MKRSLLSSVTILLALSMMSTTVFASDVTNDDYAITDEDGNSVTNNLDLDDFGVTVTSSSA